MDIKIFEEKDKDARFWALMGFYLGRREIRRELPYLIDDKGYAWFVAMDGEVVAGFCSVHVDSKKAGHLHGCYVLKDFRNRKVGDRLMKSALKWLRGQSAKKFTAVCSPDGKKLFARHGFKEAGQRGSYSVMTMEDGHEPA